MILILELSTLALALAYSWQQLRALLTLKVKPAKYNSEHFKAGCYQVRWH